MTSLAGIPPFARLELEQEHARSRRDHARSADGREPSTVGETHHHKRPGRLAGVPAFAAVLLLGCGAPPARPPVPHVAAELGALAGRVEQLAHVRSVARRLDAAERALVLSSSPRERRAARAAWLDARHELRALAREPGGAR